MKKLTYFIVITFALISCGGDDGPTITHEMGSWNLDSFILTNVPSDYSNNEGRIFGVSQISFGGVVFESYEITFNSDQTFERNIGLAGPNVNENGTWKLEGDDLTLTSEDGENTQEYSIEKNEDDQLWWSTGSQFSLLKNSVADTLTQEWVNTLSDDDFFALFDQVSVDLVFAFERQ